MAEVFLKPKTDKLKVRNPANGQYLAAEGETVELTSFWRRRLRDGDVVGLKGEALAAALKAIKAKEDQRQKEAEAAAKEQAKASGTTSK